MIRVNNCHFLAMDTEFPGVVARPIGEFKSTSDYQYQVQKMFSIWCEIIQDSSFPQFFIFLQLLRCNVDLLKIIQLGLTFFNADGEMPEGVCTWQVRIMFSLLLLLSMLFSFLLSWPEPNYWFSVQLQVQSVWGHVCWGQCGASPKLRHPIWPPWKRGKFCWKLESKLRF